jgi:hypothetical protein
MFPLWRPISQDFRRAVPDGQKTAMDAGAGSIDSSVGAEYFGRNEPRAIGAVELTLPGRGG